MIRELGVVSLRSPEAEHAEIRAGERTGRPLGSARLVVDLEQRLDRVLARRKAGRKPKAVVG